MSAAFHQSARMSAAVTLRHDRGEAGNHATTEPAWKLTQSQ